LKSTVIEKVSFSLIQSAPLEKPAARFCFCSESVSLVGAITRSASLRAGSQLAKAFGVQ